MHAHLRASVVILAGFMLLTGFAYPLVLTGIAHFFFPAQAEGSLVRLGDRIIGSNLIAQSFTDAAYLHPRPSAVDWDASASGASNLGPTSAVLIVAVKERIAAFRADTEAVPPIDAVTASGSGLDPDVSPQNVRAQAARIARARGIERGKILDLVASMTERRFLGLYGQPRVNVLQFNLALDAAFGAPMLAAK